MERKLDPTCCEGALKVLAKLVKAVHYYPPEHPSLQGTAEEALLAFSPLLEGGEPLVWTIRKDNFLLGEKAVAPENPSVRKMASFLFARRIQQLLFFADLSTRDLLTFARKIGLEPLLIQNQGGVQEILRQSLVSTIWVNEVDLSRILVEKAEMEAAKAKSPEETDDEELLLEPENVVGSDAVELPPADEQSSEERLELLLKKLESAREGEDVDHLIQELVPLIRTNLTESARHLVLRAVLYLLQNSAGAAGKRRESANQALHLIATDQFFDFLLVFLCVRGLADDTRQSIHDVLSFFGQKSAPRLLERLVDEDDAQARKFLAEALVRQGAASIPFITPHLSDPRWYVVRNAAAILGEIRDQQSTPFLSHLLDHLDIRVRREAIRALARIGGKEGMIVLLQTVDDGEPELRRQALLSLGAMKNPAAVPVLLRLINQPDPMVKDLEVKKGAIRALGEIGSEEAVPDLIQLLNRRKFWRRARFDELRAAAAAALGDIGGELAVAALKEAEDDRSSSVARAAVQALRYLRKGVGYGPGPA